MKKFVLVTLALLGIASPTLHAQCTTATHNGNSWQIPYNGHSTSVTYSLGTITTGQYATLDIIQGFTYRFTSCGINFDSQLTIINNANGSVLAYNDDNGSDCTGNAASVDWTATFTGRVRVHLHRYNCAGGANSGTVNVKVVGGSNTLDNQNQYGNNQWIGHVYDGTNFNIYVGNYTEPSNINQNFGASTGSFQLYSNSMANGRINLETFSARYRMTKTDACGTYTITVGGDDGYRLYINGQLVINNWSDHAYQTSTTSYYFDGTPVNLVLEYYENSDGNQVYFDMAQTSSTVINNVYYNAIPPVSCTGNGGAINFILAENAATGYFSSDFGNAPSNVTYYGSATQSNGELVLTTTAGSVYGGFYMNNPNGYNSGVFEAEFDFRVWDGSGADGFSFNYGALPAISAYAAYEAGVGNNLNIRFHSYGTPRIAIGYAGAELTSSTAIGVRNSAYQRCKISVNRNNQLTLIVGSTTVFNNYALPAAYGTADKSTWVFGFAGRTGGSTDRHSIDNVYIKLKELFQYSINGGTSWQTNPSFTNLTAGTYNLRVRGLNTTNCAYDAGSVTLTTPPTPAISSTFTNEVCPADDNGTITPSLSGGLSNVRYIRIQQNRNDAQAFINLAEVQAFEIFSGTNVAFNKSVTYSSLYSNDFPGSELVNNITSTANDMFHSGTAGANQWVEIDLGASYNLDYINVWNRSDCCFDRASNLQLILKNASGTIIHSRTVDVYQNTNAQVFPATIYDVLGVSWQDGATAFNRSSLNSGTYRLNYSDVSGCTTLHDRSISASKTESVAAGITGTNTICAGNTTTLSASGGSLGTGAQWQWYTNPALTTSAGSGSSINVNPSSATTYYVRAQGDCNNTGTASQAITVNPLPAAFSPSIITALPICYRGNAQINVPSSQTGTSYQLRNNTTLVGGSRTGNGNSLVFHTANLIADANTYNILATTGAGCTSSVNIPTVTVNDSPSTLPGTGSVNCVCYVNGKGTGDYIEFKSGTGAILGLNPGTDSLGYVTVNEYIESSPVNIQACNTSAATAPQYTSAALARHWTIRSDNPPTSVNARLYYANNDLTALSSAANINTNPNDDVYTASDLELTKYSGPNEDNLFTNNCTPGGTITLINQTGSGSISGGVGYTISGGSYLNYPLNSFSELWLSGTNGVSPLPIKLISFNAICEEDDKIQLKWITASEINNERFDIHRSADLQNWELVTTLPGAGSSNAPIIYEAKDLRPLSGLSYYRLTQIDFDGTAESFPSSSVSCNSFYSGITIFPNPTSDAFTLSIHAQQSETYNLRITDLNGKLVLSKNIHLENGNNQFIIPVQEWTPGTYLIFPNIDSRPLKLVVTQK